MIREKSQWTRGTGKHGSDFAGDQWRHSDLIDWARTEGTAYPLYTNWPVMSYFYLRRPARDVPRLEESARMAAFADSVRVRGGRILAFNWPGVEYVPADSMIKVPGLRVVVRRTDGVVLAPADDPTPVRRPRSAPPSRPR